MTNKESGRYIAQIFSDHAARLLQAIYNGTVEPHKQLNEFEKGAIDELRKQAVDRPYLQNVMDKFPKE